jgi:hypothetical protein
MSAIPSMACGRAMMTSDPVSVAETTTLQGSRRPMPASSVSARCANCGLQAPRMTYGLKSTSSFWRKVVLTSISVSTPKPSDFSASVTLWTAVSYGVSGSSLLIL